MNIPLEDPRIKIALDALRDISNTDLYDYSPDGDGDFHAEANSMVQVAEEAIKRIEAMT